MAATGETCRMHRTILDSYCFTHHTSCCLKCHSKILKSCDIVGISEAHTRLLKEATDYETKFRNVTGKMSELIGTLEERENSVDEWEKRSIEKIEQFYNSMRDVITKQEESVKSHVYEILSEQRERIRELRDGGNGLMSENQMSTSAHESSSGNIKNIATEDVHKTITNWETLVACGNDFIERVDEISNKMIGPLYSIDDGGRDIRNKLESLIADVWGVDDDHEGAVTSREGAVTSREGALTPREGAVRPRDPPTNEKVHYDDITQIEDFTKVNDWTQHIDEGILDVKYIDNTKPSDLIVLVWSPRCLRRVNEDGAVVFQTNIARESHPGPIRFANKGEFIFVVCDGNKLNTFNTETGKLMKSVKLSGNVDVFTVVRDKLVVGSSKFLRLYSSDGKNILTEYGFGGSEYNYLAIDTLTSDDRIVVFYGDYSNYTITVLSPKLVKLWTINIAYQPHTTFPHICVYGTFVLVSNAGDMNNSGTVTWYNIDCEWHSSGVLVSGLDKPEAIAYNGHNKHLAVERIKQIPGGTYTEGVTVYEGHILLL